MTRISNISKKEITSPLQKKTQPLEIMINQITKENEKEEPKENQKNKENKVSKERFNQLRKRLMLLLKDEKFFLIGGAISASCNGAIWPIYGILLADAIGTLAEPVMEEVSQGGLNISMMFLALAFIAAIILWMQKYYKLN
jgi:hypothetical protein